MSFVEKANTDIVIPVWVVVIMILSVMLKEKIMYFDTLVVILVIALALSVCLKKILALKIGREH